MDREYKEILYGAMFDELDRLQSNKLHTDGELQKEALGVSPQAGAGLLSSVGRGFKQLATNPAHAWNKNIAGAYRHGAAGSGGVAGGIKNVLGTDAGKALAAGGVGAAGLLGTGFLVGNQR